MIKRDLKVGDLVNRSSLLEIDFMLREVLAIKEDSVTLKFLYSGTIYDDRLKYIKESFEIVPIN